MFAMCPNSNKRVTKKWSSAFWVFILPDMILHNLLMIGGGVGGGGKRAVVVEKGQWWWEKGSGGEKQAWWWRWLSLYV